MKIGIYLKRKNLTHIVAQSFLLALVTILLFASCKKTKEYAPIIPYNTTIDTATLKIKVINPPLASGVDVTLPTTKVILYLFDSKNLFLSQTPYNGILTEDTSILLTGIQMGHYTALLVLDRPGITNLNYLAVGKQSYQEVVDTLQYLLTDTYVGSSQNVVVNKKENEGILQMVPMSSIVAQVSFDISKISDAWLTKPDNTNGMAMLLFQNGVLVKNVPISETDIANNTFAAPVPQGTGYSFLFVEMINQKDICVLEDSLKEGKGILTITDIQALAERHNNGIRMGMVGTGAIPIATIKDLAKPTENLSVVNCMEQVSFTFPTDMKDVPKPTNSEGFVLLEFQDNKMIRQLPIPEDSLKKASFTTTVLKGSNYNFMTVDLLKVDGKFNLNDQLKPKTATVENIRSWVEPYNQGMRMGTIFASLNVDQNIGVFPIVNGLALVTFDLKNLFSKPGTAFENTDGFALLEFKDGVLIKKTDIPYTNVGTNGTDLMLIPDTYTTSVVKAKGYSFWFVDLAKSKDGTYQLKNQITNGGDLVKNINIADVKNSIEPYLNQNIRMGTIAESDLTASATLTVTSLIQQVKLNFTGAIGCNNWNTAPNWSVLILDQSGYYKRTAIKNVADYTTPFNIFTGSKYYIAAVGGFSTDISKVELATTNYNTLATINTKNPAVQPNLYSWLAIDSCLAGQTTYENHATSGTITLNATSATNSPIKVLTQIDKIPVKTIGYLRTLLTGYNTFGCNPINIKGVVTMNGKGKNDLIGWYILQDPNGTTGTIGAIPIQFKTDPNLSVGDQVTISIQDGDLATVNNMLLLQNVTYTLVTKDVGTYSVTPKSLGNITSLTPSANDEAMVVSITNVEFRYWKGQYYSDVVGDAIEVRDASVAATILPSARKLFKLKMNALSPTDATFGQVPIPIGKSNVTGILAKNSANQYAIQPRNKNDITTTINTMANRVDAGVVVDWNPNASSNDGITNSSGVFKTALGRGVACNSASSITGNTGASTNITYTMDGSGFYTSSGFYVSGLSTAVQLQASTANAGKGLLINLNTTELVNNENIQLTLNGWRSGTSNTIGGNTADINFKVQYRQNSSASWIDVPPVSTFKIAGVYLNTAPHTFDCGTITIPNIGGYTTPQIQIVVVNGGTWGSSSSDNNVWFYRVTLTQIP